MPDAGTHPASALSHALVSIVAAVAGVAMIGSASPAHAQQAQQDSVELAVPTVGSVYVRYGPAPARATRPGAAPVRLRAPAPYTDPGSLRLMVRAIIEEERALLDARSPRVAATQPAAADAATPRTRLSAAEIDRLAMALEERLMARIERSLTDRRVTDSIYLRGLVAREMNRLDIADRRSITDAPRQAPVVQQVAPTASDAVIVAITDSLRLLERRQTELITQRDTTPDPALTAEIERLRARTDSLERARRMAMAEREATERAAAMAEQQRYEALRRLDRLIGAVTEIRETERGLSVVLGQGLFAVGQSRLSARALDELRTITGVLTLYPEHPLTLEGHTDATGSADSNEQLAWARARAVRDALVARGIDPGRIAVEAYGERLPIADNATAEGRARNRRVEIVIEGARPPSESATR